MAYDGNLVLDAGQTLTNEAQTTQITVEGGILAWLNILFGTLAADADALNIRLQYLPTGSTWFTCPGGRVEQILGTNDSDFVRVPVFIPETDTKGDKTPLRLDYELSENGTESFVITRAWLDPVYANAPQEVDLIQAQGLYI